MIGWALHHWWTLAGLGITASLVAVSLAGICVLFDDCSEEAWGYREWTITRSGER